MSWDFAVEAVNIVDGDTVDLRVDLGFHHSGLLRFRLLDCDTPERHELGWRECTQFTKDWLSGQTGRLRAETFKSDSFGRWLARVYAVDAATGERRVLADAINAHMEKNGWTSPAVR